MTSSEESKPPSLSALARGNDMITIDVGPDHQKYRIYKELISYYSEYFRNALKKPWKEADDRIVELPDIEPQVFDVFVDWLYSQKLPEKNRHWIKPTDETESNSTSHVQQVEILIVKTYVFADRFLTPKLRCAIYNHLAASLIKDAIPPYYEVIIFAFENLTEKSPMLDLLVGVHCAFWDENCDTESNGELDLRKELPVDFFLRVMIQSSKMKDKEKAKNLVECGCHKAEPTEREGCESCRSEDKVEEAASGEAQAGVTAQANDGAAADTNQDSGEADEIEPADGDQEGDEAVADVTASGDGVLVADEAQSSDAVQPVEVEVAAGGTIANDEERGNGASPAEETPTVDGTPEASEVRPNVDAQINIADQTGGQAHASTSATTNERDRMETPARPNASTQIRKRTPSVRPTAADGGADEVAVATQTDNVATVVAAPLDTISQHGPVVSSNETDQSSRDMPAAEGFQLEEQGCTSPATSSAVAA